MKRATENPGYQPRHSSAAAGGGSVPIIRYLIYLLIITTTVTGVSLSRYSTSMSSGNSAGAAALGVAVSSFGWDNYGTLIQEDSDKAECSFEVDNYGETAVKARLVYKSDGLPFEVAEVTEYGSSEPLAVDGDGWFNLAPGGTAVISVFLAGSIGGNVYDMRVEYEQIN